WMAFSHAGMFTVFFTFYVNNVLSSIIAAVAAPAGAVAPAKAQFELVFIWGQATVEAKIIIIFLALFSIMAWSVMAYKAVQMRKAKKLNRFFDTEYAGQPQVLGVFDRRLNVEGCPIFSVYQQGCLSLEARLKTPEGTARKTNISLKAMEHVKRALESAVARESLKLESGLILLAIAVSGGPFIGLLGTVWGV